MWCGAWKMAKQDGNPLATMLLRQQKMAGSLPSPSLSPFALSPVVLVRARPSGAPIGQIRSLDRSHLLRFMHIFQKRKELPPFGSRWARRRRRRWRRRQREGEREEGLVRPPPVRPTSYLHACCELRGVEAAVGGQERDRRRERGSEREGERGGEKSGYLFPIYVSGTRRASVVPTTQREGGPGKERGSLTRQQRAASRLHRAASEGGVKVGRDLLRRRRSNSMEKFPLNFQTFLRRRRLL